MATDSTIDYSTLSWVKEEIDETMKQARLALEEYVENQDDATQLRFCVTYIHQVYGTLQMVELYGASLFAEEMELLIQALLANEVPRKDDAHEVLMRAILQLPDYLERIQCGMKDNPLILMPIMNDLRAAREETLLSESALFAPNLKDAEPIVVEESADLFGVDPKALAKKLRPLFQIGLLGWYRDTGTEGSLKKIIKVMGQLEQVCTRDDVVRLWWVAKGIAESLLKKGVEESITLKLLLGRVDREIKRMIDRGEQELVSEPAEELLKNLLYYIAQSRPVTKRVQDIQLKFSLTSALSDGKEVESARESLSGPNAQLMETVSVAISEDLSRVKDSLDLLLRSDERDLSTLEPMVDVLKKMADTLGMLGMGVPRKVIQEQVSVIGSMISGDLAPDEAQLMDIAGALLFVESSLVGMVESSHAEEQARQLGEGQDAETTLANIELRQVNDVVLKEITVEISKSKDAIVAFLDAPMDFDQLKVVPHLFETARGGLAIMGLDEVSRLVEVTAKYLTNDLMLRTEAPPQYELDNIADVISSIEYYLEAVHENRANRDAILDVTYEGLRNLDYKVERPKKERKPAGDDIPATRASEPPQSISQDQEVELSPSVENGDSGATEPQDSDIAGLEQEVITEVATDATKQEPAPVIDNDLDEDIVDIFIEEAEEVLEEITETLSQWKEDLENNKPLTTIRRSFHTLKGSGRLVGALKIGEFSWSVENILNRVLDGTIQPSPRVIDILETTIRVLPGLIGELKGEGDIDFDIQAFATEIEDEIHALQVVEPSLEISGEIMLPEEGLQESEVIRVMDPVLYEIFNKESTVHIGVIETYLESVDGLPDEKCLVTESLVRSLHTLHGSARMAGADDIAEIASSFEKYVKILHENVSSVNSEGRALLGSAIKAFEEFLSLINTSGESESDIKEMLEKVGALYKHEIEKQEEIVRKEQDEAFSQKLEEFQEDSDEEFDQEVVEVFLEEGSEILDSCEIILQKISESPDESETLIELQREMHTLKGGARMAGVKAIGDLSHAVESCLAAVGEGSLSLSAEMIDMMQRAIDRLIRLLEKTKNNESLDIPEDLIKELVAIHTAGSQQESTEKEITSNESPVKEIEPDSGDEETAEILDFPVAGGTGSGEPVEPEEPVDLEEPVKPEEREELVEPEEPVELIDAEQQSEETQSVEKVKQDRLRDLKPVEIPPPIPSPIQVTSESAPATAGEQVRVRSDLLDNLVNYAGEVSIFRSRLEQQIGAFKYNLVEMDQTVYRLREQLRKLEMETEAQILFRYEGDIESDESFDPLELDRYSTMQQLSRALMETTADIDSIQNLLGGLVRESETLMIQQARVNTDLQEGLMRTRMVSFSGLIPRLQRILRQISQELGKKAKLNVTGEGGELDRNVLERITAPLEHMLRNALSHGIESPEERKSAGKNINGTINLSITREGSEIVLILEDDGRGMDLEAIRKKAEERGLIEDATHLSNNDIMQFILESGFSTAEKVTQISGRGVGMDVVNSEIKQLGGSLNISSETGKGARFVIRLPLTLAMNHALLVKVADESYAVPLSSIEGIVRMSHEQLEEYAADPDKMYQYAGNQYQVQRLGQILHANYTGLVSSTGLLPVILVRSGDHQTALQVDGLMGSREIVVKSVGPQLSTLRGVSGATILGDGRVVLILDMGSIIRLGAALKVTELVTSTIESQEQRKLTVMVVDDSITVRKVTTRLLERNDMNVITAKDGVDAVTVLQDHIPDIMLLDIEMPRMDGFELATHMRNEPRLKAIPIIMITSRTGDKHRRHAEEIGVERYLGKPFQEHDLLENINSVLEQIHGHA